MLMSAAFSVFQVMTTAWPGCAVAGVAAIVAVGAGGGGGGGGRATGVLLGQPRSNATESTTSPSCSQDLKLPGKIRKVLFGQIKKEGPPAIQTPLDGQQVYSKSRRE